MRADLSWVLAQDHAFIFSFKGEPWRCVSSQAKSLTKSLLTVDPRKRVSMDQLRNNSWIGYQGQTHHMGALLTTTILSSEPLERCLKQTYDAFHNVTREGFRLTPVSSASSKLAQKRKMKQSLSSDTSSLSELWLVLVGIKDHLFR